MLAFLVSLIGGIIAFVIFYALIGMRRYLPQYQTKVRLNNLNDAPQTTTSTRNRSQQRQGVNLMAINELSSLSFKDRIILPIYFFLQNLFMKLAPHAIFKTIERSIVLAGKQDFWSLNVIIFAWGMSILGCFSVGMLVFTTSDYALIQRIMILALATVIGVMFPLSFLKSVIRKRQERMVMQLPSFLDLLCVSVQAGLSFDAALDRNLRRMTGPLIDEFKRMQRDMKIGLNKADALRELARRCDVEELYLFTTSVIQAERLGTSMGKTLIDQANNMRDRYQQSIKAKALKAPIKILFPLVMFIFPTIFIIVLFPPLISVLNNLQIIPRG